MADLHRCPSGWQKTSGYLQEDSLAEKLDYFIPFLLYRVMAKGIRRATNDYAKLNLTIQEARVLIALAQHRTMRVGSLAELTCIEQSALSHMLRSLSRRNLVKRDRVKDDNRSVDVALTTDGLDIARSCQELSKKHEEVMLSRFSGPEQRAVRSLLNKMYENVEEWATGGTLTVANDRGKRKSPAK